MGLSPQYIPPFDSYDARAGITGGYQPGGVLGAVGPVGAGLLAITGPVGAVASGVLAALAALGISVRGKTQHLSQSQVEPVANQWVGMAEGPGVWPLFLKAYSYEELQVIASRVRARFLTAMAAQWGVGTSSNEQIARDVEGNSRINYALNRQLWLFMIWIGTNVDLERLEDEYSHVVPVYFNLIFISAIQDAGLDPARLGLSGGVPLPGSGDGLPPTPPPPGGGTGLLGGFNTGSVNTLLFAGILLGGYLLSQKGK